MLQLKKKKSKTKVLRYLKVMIPKFCTARHLFLIFIRRILPPPQNYFSNKCSSIVYTKSGLDLLGQFFLKMMLGEHVWMGEQKYFRESTTDGAMFES